MALQINWGVLSGAPDAGLAFSQGVERGSRRAQEQAGQDALRALAVNPADTGAYANLMAVSPDQAYRFRSDQRSQAEYNRVQQFRGALSDYMTGGGGAPTRNVLTGLERPTPGAAGSMAGMPGVIDALGGSGIGAAQMPGVPAVDALAPPDGADVVVTARTPQRRGRMPGGDGWDDVVRADPEKALAASRSMYGTQKQELEAWQTVSSAGMQMLGGVHDQDSWDREGGG